MSFRSIYPKNHPITFWMDLPFDHFLRYVFPFFYHDWSKMFDVLWVTVSDTTPDQVSQKCSINERSSDSEGRGGYLKFFSAKNVATNSRRMETGVVMLKDIQFIILFHSRGHVRRRVRSPWGGVQHWWFHVKRRGRFFCAHWCRPKPSHISFSKWMNLDHIVVLVTGTIGWPNLYPSLVMRSVELALVGDKKSTPLWMAPPSASLCPWETEATMVIGSNCDRHKTFCILTPVLWDIFLQSVDWL